MTIFEALRKDHDIQRDLLARLVETHGDSDERDSLYKQVKKSCMVMPPLKSGLSTSRSWKWT
ncbi:hypothetical protein HSBAA_44370 [Vreelandella sulfidaeris]|uniref:Hemerythrin-like domain-containing protein n=1 Tax=Vreelandella sulfidaeris TaxID=115553 RepID=A0A455UEQ9_9GAMM|nr:hypothetical protein HSBAA_44370 [Halomonas sulfidaeris]